MRLVVNVALLVVIGCVDTPRLQEPDIESSHVAIVEMFGTNLPKLDVLVVIDDSATMLPYRERVATLAPLLARQLGELTSQWVDIQIAVTGNDGQFRRLGSDAAYLRDAWTFDYTHVASFDGPLLDAVATLIDTDAVTHAPSQPLEAMVRSLERNALFVRDDATFVVLIVSASDDASPLPPSEYVRWMEAFAGDSSGWFRKPVIAVGIHPQPAPRLDEYYASLRTVTRAVISPIDVGDFGPAISKLLPHVRRGGGDPCVGSIADLDAAAAGTQHECTMHVHLDDVLRSVPECPAASPPRERAVDAWVSAPEPACWQLVADPYNCTYGQRLSIAFRGYTSISHPAYRLECRTN